MRTGTKVSILIVVWTMLLVSFLIVGLVVLSIAHPDLREMWPQVAPIITALLGTGGLGFGIVEIRKAVEWVAEKKAERKDKSCD